MGMGSPDSEALFLSVRLFPGDVSGSSLETDGDLRSESEALSRVAFLAGQPSGDVSGLSRETEGDFVLESEELFLLIVAEADSDLKEGERLLLSLPLLDEVFGLGFWGSLGVSSDVRAGVLFLLDFFDKVAKGGTRRFIRVGAIIIKVRVGVLVWCDYLPSCLQQP